MKSLLKSGCLLLLLVLLPGCERPAKLSLLRPNDIVLAFGDSLTRGSGVDQESSYPAQLNQLLGRRVINAGIAGEVSADGVRRLPGLLDTHKPRLLLLLHGGNDLLRKGDEQELKDNLRRMCEAARQRGIEVVMIAVPKPNLLLRDAPLYSELAQELDIFLLEDALTELLQSNSYKSDMIHLNAPGYRRLAEAIADFLKRNGAL